jgi:hypothetical protein
MSTKKETTKNCEFCGKKFTTENSRRKYCKDACKVRAYELRKGLEAPSFLVGNEYDIIKKEVSIKVDNPKYEKLVESINQIETELKKLETQRKSTLNSLDKYKSDTGLALGVLGGGGLGFIAAKNVENDVGKMLLTIGGGLIGSILGSESEQSKVNRMKIINLLNGSLQQINADHQAYSKKLSNYKLSLLLEPKQIEKKEIKEIKVPKRQGLVRKDKKNAPFITASELSGMSFELYKLDGRFGKFLGDIAKNTFITCFGQPGSGKSTFFVQMADYLTKYGMLIYVTPEEGVSPTFQQKLNRLGVDNDQIHITAHTSLKEIRKALRDYNYKFCFIDSINMLVDSTPHDLEKLRSDFPEVLFAIIMQSTKDGKFKGSNEYAHNSDINIKIEKGLASTIKNRFGELGEFEVF